MRLYSSYMTPGIEQLTCRHRNIFFASKNLSTFFLNILGRSSYNTTKQDKKNLLNALQTLAGYVDKMCGLANQAEKDLF